MKMKFVGVLSLVFLTILIEANAGVAKRIFVTSSGVASNLGSITAYDTQCQNFANNAGVGGTWKALLSQQTYTGPQSNAKGRIGGNWAKVVNMKGEVVWDAKLVTDAPWAADGTGNYLVNPVQYDESGVSRTVTVMTNTHYAGTAYGAGNSNFTCNNYTAGAGWYLSYGNSGQRDGQWVYVGATQGCGNAYPIYCIEQ